MRRRLRRRINYEKGERNEENGFAGPGADADVGRVCNKMRIGADCGRKSQTDCAAKFWPDAEIKNGIDSGAARACCTQIFFVMGIFL